MSLFSPQFAGLQKRYAALDAGGGGEVVLRRIDSGRADGGTIDGWEQDSFWTGDHGFDWKSGWGNFATDTSNVDDPPTQLACQWVYLITGGPIIGIFSGIDSAHSHKLRLFFSEAHLYKVAGQKNLDVKVNTVTRISNYDVIASVGFRTMEVKEIIVAAGVSSITVEIISVGTDYSFINAIELRQF